MVKRLVGGMILLNLCAISLSVNGGEVDITNEDVKSQLVELRNFIDEKRDFTKGAKDLKPVLVQYRSSESKIDGVVQCNMGFNTDALHLSIGGTAVLHDGEKLTISINVEYQYTDYVGYTIKTAKLNVVLSNKLFISLFNNSGEFDFEEDVILNVGDKFKIIAQGIDSTYIAYGEIINVDDSGDVYEMICTPLFLNIASPSDKPIEKFLCTKLGIDIGNKLITYFNDIKDGSMTISDDMGDIDIYKI